MLFNSFSYLLYLPIVVGTYYLSNKINYKLGKIVLVISNCLFYYFNEKELFYIFVISIVINYCFSLLVCNKKKEIYKYLPIVINILLLLYFKYTNFFIVSCNDLFNSSFNTVNIVVPVGISFFTFQQIAYIVSVNNKEVNTSFIDYILYITYFPKLLMGPLMEPRDFYSQINDKLNKKINIDNIAKGIKIFSFGLFKKAMIADVFCKAVNYGFENFTSMGSIDWLLITLFYSFEIYFDFSAYTDMAVGSSLLLNITLPINFDSPYKSLSISDFWSRWHISLTSFFRKYLYIPLGGNRKGKVRTYINIFLIFLISGFWHGASWTFILWGIINGLLMIFDRIFKAKEEKLYKPLRWSITFVCVSFLWLLFRSNSIAEFITIINNIIAFDKGINIELLNCFVLPESSFIAGLLHIQEFINKFNYFWMLVFVLAAFVIVLIPQNNYRNINKFNSFIAIIAAIAFVWGFISLGSESAFVYFGF